MLDWLFQWGRERTGLFWRELLPPASQLPVLGNRLWLLQKEKRINMIYSFKCALFIPSTTHIGLVCTWSARIVSSPARRVRLMSFRSTCGVWSGTCRSHCAGSAGVSVHPGTGGEAAGCGRGVGEGDLCVGRQLERTWGFLPPGGHLEHRVRWTEINIWLNVKMASVYVFLCTFVEKIANC